MTFAALAVTAPAFGQRAEDRQDNRQGSRDNADSRDAKEIITLIKQGQLDLAAATKLAEKHVNGTAIRATCAIRNAEQERGDERTPPGDSAQAQPTGRRLVYDITCFAEDKVQLVQVDGLTKRVIERARPQDRQP